MIRAYASRTGTRRNLDALRRAGWGLFVSAAGVHRDEGCPFVIDNGAWSAFTRGEPWDEGRFVAVLDKLAHLETCEGIVAPDVVCGGAESLRLSLAWLDRLLDLGPRVYLAVQPGIAPWAVAPHLGERVGLFVGGDSSWKEATCAVWARLAHERGALCHVGRVNTLRRLLIVKAAGADSFDGSGPSRFEAALHKMERARKVFAQVSIELQVVVDVFWGSGVDDGARLEARGGAAIEELLLIALDRCGTVLIYEVQTDDGVWELFAAWRLSTWDQLEGAGDDRLTPGEYQRSLRCDRRDDEYERDHGDRHAIEEAAAHG